MAWLDENFGLENCIARAPAQYRDRVHLQWPASSPDLTPLDFSSWPILKNYLDQRIPNGRADNRNQIIEIAKHVWDNVITMDQIKNICAQGFLHRMQRCIEADGHSSESLAHLRNSRDSIGDLPLSEDEIEL
jgi:hypothetical protein